MKWERKDTPRNASPCSYMTEYKGMKLSISVPQVKRFSSASWSAKLTFGPQTLHNATFRLRGLYGPESADDLEKAKKEAFVSMSAYIKCCIDDWTKMQENPKTQQEEVFAVMADYIKGNMDYWVKMQELLEEMRVQSEDEA